MSDVAWFRLSFCDREARAANTTALLVKMNGSHSASSVRDRADISRLNLDGSDLSSCSKHGYELGTAIGVKVVLPETERSERRVSPQTLRERHHAFTAKCVTLEAEARQALAIGQARSQGKDAREVGHHVDSLVLVPRIAAQRLIVGYDNRHLAVLVRHLGAHLER